MKVISVKVGLPREVVWKGITVHTAIFKEPVGGPVAITKLNLAGDQQTDLIVHGGSEKAVYVYPAEHYEHWRKQVPEVRSFPFCAGFAHVDFPAILAFWLALPPRRRGV